MCVCITLNYFLPFAMKSPSTASASADVPAVQPPPEPPGPVGSVPVEDEDVA